MAEKTSWNRWIPTRIEDLRAFDVVLHAGSVWVIHRIDRIPQGDQTFHATRVDDGKQTRWVFSVFAVGYLMQRFERGEA